MLNGSVFSLWKFYSFIIFIIDGNKKIRVKLSVQRDTPLLKIEICLGHRGDNETWKIFYINKTQT